MRTFENIQALAESKATPKNNEHVMLEGGLSGGDGGSAIWVYSGVGSDGLSMLPSEIGRAAIIDASGNEWNPINLGRCQPECLGVSEFRFYVSTSGSDENIGLFPGFPLKTPQKASDNIGIFSPSYGGDFYLDLEEGVYNDGVLFNEMPTYGEIIIEGKLDESENQTVIFDGTSASTSYGVNCNGSGVKVRVKNIKVDNYSSNLIAFQNGAVGVIDTCVGDRVQTFGFNASERSDMVLIGRCTISCDTGGRALRYYRNATGSVGDGSNDITLLGDGNIADGMDIRNGAEVVCNNKVVIDGFANKSILIRNGGFLELRETTLSNNEVAVSVDDLSRFAEEGPITYTDNIKNKEYTGFSIKQGSSTNTLIGVDDESGEYPSTGYDLIIDNDGATGIQALTGGGNFSIDSNKTERILFDPVSERLRFYVANNEAFQVRAPNSNQTGVLLLVNDGVSTSIKRVNLGAADSGGTGQRLLTVEN